MSQPEIVANRYQILRTLGKGGMGTVYEALDKETGQTVAVKALKSDIIETDASIIERFEREGEALRLLNHPNIVKMRASIESEGNHYLIMDYVAGGTLADLMSTEELLPIPRVMDIALDVADALTRAHRLKILHRDIKPANVLIATDGTPRLTDFGVARMENRTRVTETGTIVGTYNYLSPEALQGGMLDERVDIWAFGVMLFEMLTGQRPFQREQVGAIVGAILTDPVPDIKELRPDIPAPLAELVYKMLEKDPNDRIGSARHIGVAIEDIIRNVDSAHGQNISTLRREVEERPRFDTPTGETEPKFTGQSFTGAAPGTGSRKIYSVVEDESGEQFVVMPKRFARRLDLIGGVVFVALLVAVAAAILLLSSGGDDDSSGSTGDTPTQVAGASGGDDDPTPADGASGAAGGASGGETTPEPEPTRPLAPAPPPTRAIPPGASPAGGMPTLVPVADDEYMVLVAQPEYVGTTDQTRDVARFIVGDLRSNLETLPFSKVRIRTTPGVIINEQQAAQVAQQTGAAVIVWGNYDDELVTLNVQAGVDTAFTYNAFEMDLLRRTGNVRVELENERRQSIAPQVLAILGGWHVANGDAYEFMKTLALLDTIDVTSADVAGPAVAAATHRYFRDYIEDTPQAIAYIEEALELDTSNPLLYTMLSVAQMRIGLVEDALRSADTAQRLGPDDWAIPMYLHAASIFYDPTANQMRNVTEIISLRPDDWYAYSLRGQIYYYAGMYERAREDFERAAELDPDTSLPYVFLVFIASREARMDEVDQLMDLILEQYPDPSLLNRVFAATFGDELQSEGVLLEAFGYLLIGQPNRAIEQLQAAEALTLEDSDLLFLYGTAHCEIEAWDIAEEAYQLAIEEDPTFGMLHLLYISTLVKQDKRVQMTRYVRTLSDNIEPSNRQLRDYIDAFQTERSGCEGIF